ncbi:DUF3307 domain-containing protein [Aquimarina sp. LLG6339-5]|uniref:DUF3307 domain-containing protein n=1 Tax=Aquimarina sp. LLG6339-5 TaxID=3160830 RepID=UPI00386D43F2
MIFCFILIAHWIGDFAFQTSKMALRKSEEIKWLGIHVIVYMAVLGVFSIFLFPIRTAIIYIIINTFLHGLTDFFTSKLTMHYREKPRIFFPLLGLDQMIHGITLYVTYIYLETFIFF